MTQERTLLEPAAGSAARRGEIRASVTLTHASGEQGFEVRGDPVLGVALAPTGDANVILARGDRASQPIPDEVRVVRRDGRIAALPRGFGHRRQRSRVARRHLARVRAAHRPEGADAQRDDPEPRGRHRDPPPGRSRPRARDLHARARRRKARQGGRGPGRASGGRARLREAYARRPRAWSAEASNARGWVGAHPGRGPVPAEEVQASIHHPRAIEFLAADGTVVRRITEGWETRVEDDRMVAEGISIAANEHFAVVTHGRSTQADGATSLLEEQAATGGNAVALYDARGQVVFENPQVDYACVEVARTGEALACLVSRPDGPDEPVNAKPDVYSVLVLGRDGAVRARFDERTGRILDDEIALSPNGRWLAWAVIGERGRHRGMLVDLTTGTAREVESERIRELFAVSDEGDLLAGTRWVRQGTRDLLAQTAVTPRG